MPLGAQPEWPQIGHVRVQNDPPTGLVYLQLPCIARGVRLGHWGGAGAVGLADRALRGLNDRFRTVSRDLILEPPR